MAPGDVTRNLTLYFLFALVAATLGPSLFGFHLAELNAPQDVITCTRKSINTRRLQLPQCIPMTSAQFGLVSSIFTLGGLLGALTSGPFAARKGRLTTMKVTTSFLIIGPIFEALAANIATMTVGRFISGIGAGATVVVVPIYISEIAPPHEKGFFGSFTQIMINVGIFIAQLLGYFLSRGQYWRIVLGMGGVIGALQLIGLLFAVESPKWTADQGRPGKAKSDLRKIRGHDVDVTEEIDGWGIESGRERNDEEETLLDNEDHMTEHSGGRGSDSNREQVKKDLVGIFEVLRSPEHNQAVIVVMMVMVAQQLCGVNSIVMYGVSLLADLLASNSALLNVAVAALNVIVTTACAPLVDKIGRKTCLLGSIAGMGTSSVLLAIGILKHVPVLSAIVVALFIASFGLGLGPVPFILSSELVGPEAVGATQSWALAANWIATFVVAQFFPILNEALGKGKVYFLFAALAAFFFALVLYAVPETKGKKSADEVWGRGRRDD